MSEDPLGDQLSLITGGARGIGLGIAHAIAERNGRLALFDIAQDALDGARESLPSGTEVGTYVVDVTDRAAVADAVRQAEADLGPVHALFNNAGVIDSVSPSRMRGDVWDWVISVNLHGVYNGLQAVLPEMIARAEGGFVVNTASMAGLVGGGSGFAYQASKAAVVGLSESLREELAHHGITVCVVCPGAVASDIVQNTRALRPATAESHSGRVIDILDAAHEDLQANGVSITEAGRRIVEGMLAGLPYLFTDASWGPAIEQRTAAVLASLHAAYPPAIHPDLAGST